MNKRFWIRFGLAALAAVPAWAGEVSGGADIFQAVPAYFRSPDGKRAVTICYEVSPRFGVDPSELEPMLRWSFETWADYIEKKQIHTDRKPFSPEISQKIASLTAGCKGAEDLRVYFGIDHPDAARFRAKLHNPLALTGVTETSVNGWWRKGVLWIAGPGAVDAKQGLPSWSLAAETPHGALKYTLLHEMGHVFGNGHVTGTIMWHRSGEFLEQFVNPRRPTQGVPAASLRIDGSRELFLNLHLAADFTLRGGPGYRRTSVLGASRSVEDVLADAYQRIFGKAPQGKVTATAHRAPCPLQSDYFRPDIYLPGSGNLEIEFRDGAGRHVARITAVKSVVNTSDSSPLFEGQHNRHRYSHGVSLYGYLDAGIGKREPVIVNYNMGRGRLEVVDPLSPSPDPLLESAD